MLKFENAKGDDAPGFGSGVSVQSVVSALAASKERHCRRPSPASAFGCLAGAPFTANTDRETQYGSDRRKTAAAVEPIRGTSRERFSSSRTRRGMDGGGGAKRS